MKDESKPEKPMKPAKNQPYPGYVLLTSEPAIEPTVAAMHCAARHSIQTCQHFAGQPRFLIFSPLAWRLALDAFKADVPGSPMEPTHYEGIPVALNKSMPGIIVVAIA